MSKGIVLGLCETSCIMSLPWAEAGYECWCVDFLNEGPSPHPNINYVQADILRWLPPLRKYAMVFAFPPCTNLAVSGARWFPSKGIQGLIDGLEVVNRCIEIAEWTEAPYMVENPKSVISSYYRKPDYIFHPYEFGGYLNPPADSYPKETHLWTGGNFIFPEKRPVPVTNKEKIHNAPDSKDRAYKRSLTPKGFAQAVFEANVLV